MSHQFKLALTERNIAALTADAPAASESAAYARHLKSEVRRTAGASERADIKAGIAKAERGIALFDLMAAPVDVQLLAGIPEDATKSGRKLAEAVARMFGDEGDKSADTYEDLARLGAACVSLVLTKRCDHLGEAAAVLSTPAAAKSITSGLTSSFRIKNGKLVDRESGEGRPFLVRHVAAADPDVLKTLGKRFDTYLPEVSEVVKDADGKRLGMRKLDGASEHQAAIKANPRKAKAASKLTLAKATERMREAVGDAITNLSAEDLAKFKAAALAVLSTIEK